MRDYLIKTEPFEFISYSEISMFKGLNNHGKMVIKGYIADDNEKPYLKMLTQDIWVKVMAVSTEGEEKILFCGLVLEFTIDEISDQKMMELKIVTGTYLMDIGYHTRAFQNLNMSYSDIFGQLSPSYYKYGFIEHKTLNDRIDDFILQYEETDWGFLKRLSSRFNSYLVPNTNGEGVKYYFDLPKRKKYALDEGIKYTLKKDLNEYRTKLKAEIYGIREEDCMVCIIREREIYEMGDNLILEGKSLFVYQIESHYVGSELVHTYYLKTEAGMQVPELYNEGAAGCSMDAEVINVKEDKVQVKIAEDENAEKTSTKWFLFSTIYSSPDGTGWYCMPEIGDKVRLYIPTNKEAESYIISAVHLEVGNADRKNPDNKSLKNKHQKEICFTPDSIVITNNHGTKMELTDADGINIISEKSITITAVGDLTISSENSSLMVAGTSSVILKQRGTSIQMEEGISFTGGEFKVQ